jgi:hypothetical protein
MPISSSASRRRLRPSVFIVFSPHVRYNFTVALEKLRLHSLRKRRHDLDALFFIQVYRGLKSCTSLLENVTLRVRPGNPRTSHCLVFVLLINTVLLLGAPMLPARWEKISTYLQSEQSHSITFAHQPKLLIIYFFTILIFCIIEFLLLHVFICWFVYFLH